MNLEKTKLSPAPDFLFGLRITATSARKSIHALPSPHFFQTYTLILIPSGFYKALEMQINGSHFLRNQTSVWNLYRLAIELIEPVGKKSTWYQHLEKYGKGIHHIAFHVNGMEKNISRLESDGGKLLQKGDFTGGSYSYVDVPEVGVIFELLTSTGN